MIVPAAIKRRFESLETELSALEKEVRQTVFQFCDRHGFAYLGRPKTLDSLAEKIETGRYSRWSDLEDLFACAVIIPTLSYESQVLEFLQQAFAESETKRRGATRKPPEVFRFETTRFVGHLRATKASEASRPLFNTRFEVQIRSAFEHAWSVATHALAYKSGRIDWKTQRMAALLKAAVEQLDLMALTFETAREPIVESRWPELAARGLIAQRFSTLVENGQLPDVLAPKDWSRFADNLCVLIGAGQAHWRGEHVLEFTRSTLTQLEEEVISIGADKVPHSISLLQFAFGVMAKREILRPQLRGYCPLITPELEMHYPEVLAFEGAFMIDR